MDKVKEVWSKGVPRTPEEATKLARRLAIESQRANRPLDVGTWNSYWEGVRRQEVVDEALDLLWSAMSWWRRCLLGLALWRFYR